MANNIFKRLLDDNNVNNYTKLYLILYQLNHYEKRYIPNKLISNRLKLDIRNSRRLLKVFEDKKIIKVYYIKSKRYFKFIENNKKVDFEDFDWLSENF